MQLFLQPKSGPLSCRLKNDSCHHLCQAFLTRASRSSQVKESAWNADQVITIHHELPSNHRTDRAQKEPTFSFCGSSRSHFLWWNNFAGTSQCATFSITSLKTDSHRGETFVVSDVENGVRCSVVNKCWVRVALDAQHLRCLTPFL